MKQKKPQALNLSCTSCLLSDALTLMLKPVDTIGNCQRLAFTVSVPQHMHKITNL